MRRDRFDRRRRVAPVRPVRDLAAGRWGWWPPAAPLDDAGVSWSDVEFAAGGSRDSGHAEALVSELGLTGVPFIGVYNGCGTAGSAILTCAQAIESGAAEVALAVGFDKHDRGAFAVDPANYGLPDWYAEDGMMVTTQFFALKIQRYLHDHGLDARLLAEIAAKALRNGAITPHAWRRKAIPVDEIMAATMVNDPLTSYMFCSPSEGGAAVVLMSVRAGAAGLRSGGRATGARVPDTAIRHVRGVQSVAGAGDHRRGDRPRRSRRVRDGRHRSAARSTSPSCRTPRQEPS